MAFIFQKYKMIYFLVNLCGVFYVIYVIIVNEKICGLSSDSN